MFDKSYSLTNLDQFQEDLGRYHDLATHLQELVSSEIRMIGEDILSNYVTISSLQSWANRLGCGGILYKEGELPKPSKYSIEEVAYILSCLLPPLIKNEGNK